MEKVAGHKIGNGIKDGNFQICFIFEVLQFTMFMTTLTVHPANTDQETAIRFFLDALHVEYKSEEEVDETTYLMSSPAMAEQINTAITQEERGEGQKVSLDDIWK